MNEICARSRLVICSFITAQCTVPKHREERERERERERGNIHTSEMQIVAMATSDIISHNNRNRKLDCNLQGPLSGENSIKNQ